MLKTLRPLAFLPEKGKQSLFTSHRASKQPVSTDPAAVWQLSKRILFNVAKKVKLAIRLKLEGHGRSEAEPEELVNDAFVCLMEALPRFDPATAKFTTCVYGSLVVIAVQLP